MNVLHAGTTLLVVVLIGAKLPSAFPRAARVSSLFRIFLCSMVFTAKQAKQLKGLTGAARAAAIKSFGGNGNGGNGSGKGYTARTSRSTPNVLTQGVAAVTRRAFGAGVNGVSLAAFDAKLPLHWPLPRAVGPYTVIRTTRRFSSTQPCILFGCFQRPSNAAVDTGHWTTACAITSVDSTLNINAAGNANVVNMPLTGIGDAASMVPSAFSVQIMNPGALQTTVGILYLGVADLQTQVGARAETWNSYFDKFIQFQAPRILSAAKMALKGVQVNSYPLNMAKVSEFTGLSKASDGGFTWGATDFDPIGWAPILMRHTQVSEPPLDLEYLVTTEWRVRFDLDHPASASHSQHGISSDQQVYNLIQRASSMGNGVIDIADKIANTGQLAQQAYKAVEPYFSAAKVLM